MLCAAQHEREADGECQCHHMPAATQSNQQPLITATNASFSSVGPKRQVDGNNATEPLHLRLQE